MGGGGAACPALCTEGTCPPWALGPPCGLLETLVSRFCFWSTSSSMMGSFSWCPWVYHFKSSMKPKSPPHLQSTISKHQSCPGLQAGSSGKDSTTQGSGCSQSWAWISTQFQMHTRKKKSRRETQFWYREEHPRQLLNPQHWNPKTQIQGKKNQTLLQQMSQDTMENCSECAGQEA